MTIKLRQTKATTLANYKKHTTKGILLAVTLMLPLFVFGIYVPDAEAHTLQTCTTSTSNVPAGLAKKGSDVWVAFQGTGKLHKYSETDCSNTTYTIGGRPQFLAVSGSSRILATDEINNKIYVFTTITNSLERTVSLSYTPWDIYTDPSNSNTVWFTEPSTDNIAKITASTGSVTQVDMPGTTANPKGLVVDSSNVYVTGLSDKKIWKYVKSSSTWTSKSITEGGSYGIMVDTTNNNLYAPIYSANKLLSISTSLGSYSLINPHTSAHATDGTTPSGMFRIDDCNTDACVTYLNSGHTGAIHIQGLPEYHDADHVGDNPHDVLYDVNIDPDNFGSHVTVQAGAGSAKMVRLTHFPS